MKRLVVLAVAMTGLSGPASAQMFSSPTGGIAPDLAMSRLMNQGLRSAAAANRGPAKTGGKATSAPATSLRFAATPQAARAAEAAYVGRIRQTDPAAADAIGKMLGQHDFGKIYMSMVGEYGFRRDDAGDALTAYTILGWLIATGAAEPTPAQVKAARAQIGATMAANPSFADPAARQALGEEIVLLFVTLQAGWQGARQEGKLKEYSDGVAAMFLAQSGQDLRTLVLTDKGLAKRG